MQQVDFINVTEVLSAVQRLVGDLEFKNGFTRGWYISRAKDALDELSLDTSLIQFTKDFPFPKDTFILDFPDGLFNLRDIFLYNGDCCDLTTSERVNYKVGYERVGSGYTAKRRETGNTSNYTDPFYAPFTKQTTLYWAGIQNGSIHFSDDCLGFEKVQLRWSGYLTDQGEIPIVPRMMKQAVICFIAEKYFEAKKSEDSKMRNNWADAFGNRQMEFRKARLRRTKSDKFKSDSIREYYRRANY